jgi:LuxR family glucitol operon transcriptional activator
MIISQQRLTLFALISAIETDARDIILKGILPNKEFTEIFPKALIDHSRQKMQKQLVADSLDDTELLDFMNLGDHFQTLNRWKQFLAVPTSKLLAKTKTIETIIAIRNRVMHGRPLDFDDLPFVKNMCQELISGDPINWATTASLLRTLRRNPGHVFDFESDFELEAKDTVLHNLPSPDFDDTGFVGRTDQLDRLKKAIKGSFPIITVLGDGGLGKTSLALKALIRCARRLDESVRRHYLDHRKNNRVNSRRHRRNRKFNQRFYRNIFGGERRSGWRKRRESHEKPSRMVGFVSDPSRNR